MKRSSLNKLPRQERAIRTRNLILDTAANLLAEVGFDKLTTNLVCKRAGLTPPALYNYFSDKYKLMEEVGLRLSDETNEITLRWLQDLDQGPIEPSQLASLIKTLHQNNLDHPSAEWILRSMRAIKKFDDPQLFSNMRVIEICSEWLISNIPNVDHELAEIRARIAVEVIFSVLTMLLANPALDADKIYQETGEMIAVFINELAISALGGK